MTSLIRLIKTTLTFRTGRGPQRQNTDKPIRRTYGRSCLMGLVTFDLSAISYVILLNQVKRHKFDLEGEGQGQEDKTGLANV